MDHGCGCSYNHSTFNNNGSKYWVTANNAVEMGSAVLEKATQMKYHPHTLKFWGWENSSSLSGDR